VNHYPYLLLSDTHYHAWDAFSTVLPSGLNSRLDILLRETDRAVEHLVRCGGTAILHAGDVFHTRGSLTPSVLNPVAELYRKFDYKNLTVDVIPGNHDLESNDTKWLTSATSSLLAASVEEPSLFHPDVLMVPWYPKVDQLLAAIKDAKLLNRAAFDLVIHAPVDGVLAGIPSHGLTAAMLAELGFRRVFAGHYHNHRDFGNGVYSIGALTHQTWSDVGSKAGYLLVYEDRVEHYETQAPRFVDIQPEDLADPEVLKGKALGNYTRVSLVAPTAEEEAATRKALTEAGSAGILIRGSKAASTMTTRRSATSGLATLRETVTVFADLKGGPDLVRACSEIMSET
jgi:DNA repair exonuclease SbcCD nuclease subunit